MFIMFSIIKKVLLEIIDDTQYEPDEQFYVKLSLGRKSCIL